MNKRGLDKITSLFQSWADAVKGRNVSAQEREALRVLQEAEKNPPKGTPRSLAREEAHRCEMSFDWAGAEKAYRRAIEVDNQPLGKSSTYISLCDLYGLLGRDDEALAAAHEATKLARQAEIPVMSYALGVEASLRLRANDLQTAWPLIEENLAAGHLTFADATASLRLRMHDLHSASPLIEESFRSFEESLRSREDGPKDDLARANALVVRASYYQKLGDPAKAEADLATAWEILQPHSDVRALAGWQAALAAWWATTARLRFMKGDLSGAVAAWQEVVNRCRCVAEAPQIEGPYKFNSVAVALIELGQALEAAGEHEAAEQAFRDSRSIRRTIGVPPLNESVGSW